MSFVRSFSSHGPNSKLYIILISFLIRCTVLADEKNRNTLKRVTVGHSAILTCKLKNISDPSKVILGYSWTKNKVDVTVDSRFTVLMWGGLFIRHTRVEDAGTYKCTAKTLSHEDVPKVYRGEEIKLDILYPPTVIYTEATVITSEGSDVQLPCTARGNPSIVTTKWLWNGKHLPKSSKPVIYPNGTLLLRNVNADHSGTYKCTPFNKIGLGNSVETILKVENQVSFIQVPPKRLSAKLGESLTMVCKATTSRVSWRKINASLPPFRTTNHGGRLHIKDVQVEDSGIYECKVSSTRESLKRTVEVVVVSTPVPPVIRNVEMLSKSAVVSWERGYDGGSRQTLEIWYRISNSNDYHWKTIKNIPADVTTYVVYDVEPRQSYLFSMRGVNQMGSGVFSRIFRSDKSTSSTNDENDHVKVYTKPLAPSDVKCKPSANGYLITWSYYQTPGRPQVQYFLIEYRRLNSSLKWKSLGTLIYWETREWSIGTNILNPNVLYEFRMFSFGGTFSEPSDIAKSTEVIDSIVSLKDSKKNNDFVIAICFASIVAVFFIVASYCYCYRSRKKRKNACETPKAKNINNNYKLSQPYSSTESTLSDSEFDLCDLHDVKFIPNVSSFVLESQENPKRSHRKKAAKTKCGYKLGKNEVPCAVVGTLADKSSTHCHKENLQQDLFPENYERHLSSRDDVPMMFNTGRLLPEFPELRDSYDQFCTAMSEHSSRDDLDGKLSNTGSGMSVLSELKSSRGMRDSMYSSDESVHACKRRRKAILQENADGINHRWSMPEFAKLWKENWESDPDCCLTGQYNSVPHKKDGQSFTEQSTQTYNTLVLCNRNSNVSLPQHLQSKVNIPNSPKIEKPKSEAEESIILGESKSCPSLVSTYNAGENDSSGFYDGSDEDEDSSSSMRSRSSVSTVKENPQWHGYKADMKDSGIYANEDVDGNASVTEINVYPNDSGYSEMCSGTRYSPEGEETNFDQLENMHVEKLRQLKNITGNSNFPVYTTNDEFPEKYDKNQVTLDRNRDTRCAQLMEEYIEKRTLDTYTPSSSFYRTSAV